MQYINKERNKEKVEPLHALRKVEWLWVETLTNGAEINGLKKCYNWDDQNILFFSLKTNKKVQYLAFLVNEWRHK